MQKTLAILLMNLSVVSCTQLVSAAGHKEFIQPEVQRITIRPSEHCLTTGKQSSVSFNAARLRLRESSVYEVFLAVFPHQTDRVNTLPSLAITFPQFTKQGVHSQLQTLRPDGLIQFETPADLQGKQFLSAFFMAAAIDPVEADDFQIIVSRKSSTLPAGPERSGMLNINFGRSPMDGFPAAAVGGRRDDWNLFLAGDTKMSALKMADGSSSDITAELSENDGAWGIPQQFGVYHAYLYHNCRCVDLQLTVRDLPPGKYRVYVYAHGDAPDQNAAIDIQSGEKLYSGKKTLNDGSWDFRSSDLADGKQYVSYDVRVKTGIPVVITSRRDGSSLSMINAVQFVPLAVE